jgi:hypothetical protein
MKLDGKRISLALGLLLSVFLGTSSAQVATSPNQATADSVASALQVHPGLAASRIAIEAREGVVTLSGIVPNAQLKGVAIALAKQVGGVRVVNDRLGVGDPRVMPAQYSISGQPVRIARGGEIYGGGGEVYGGEVYGGAPTVMQDPQAPAPEGPAMGGATQAAMPGYPNYAWPSYAPHPNFSAVGYPTVYPWQAWPNIGPFYPFPEVPLDWRAVTLRWDDGLWWLDFRKHYTRPFFTPYPFGIFGY